MRVIGIWRGEQFELFRLAVVLGVDCDFCCTNRNLLSGSPVEHIDGDRPCIFIVQNLVWSGDAGAAERQAKLKDIGVYKILQQLLATTADSTLASK